LQINRWAQLSSI